MQVYDPTAPTASVPQNLRHPVADLTDKVVGFIDNAKPNFNYLVDDLAELLSSRYGVKTVVKRAKRGASMPAAAQVLDELAAQCDLVVTGSGD
jgi:uncharacterized caspase-like protein